MCLTNNGKWNRFEFANNSQIQIYFAFTKDIDMTRYSTSQRKKLLELLRENSHSSFSAKEIKEAIGALGVSKSAIYRNLVLLEKDGLIQKVYLSPKKEATYQYTGSEKCVGFIHLICENCKKSYHFEKDFSDLIVENASQLADFAVNKQKTFIYGLCHSCH